MSVLRINYNRIDIAFIAIIALLTLFSTYFSNTSWNITSYLIINLILIIGFAALLQVIRSSQALLKTNQNNSYKQLFFIREDLKKDIDNILKAQELNSASIIKKTNQQSLKCINRLDIIETKMQSINRIEKILDNVENRLSGKLNELDSKTTMLVALGEQIDKSIIERHNDIQKSIIQAKQRAKERERGFSSKIGQLENKFSNISENYVKIVDEKLNDSDKKITSLENNLLNKLTSVSAETEEKIEKSFRENKKNSIENQNALLANFKEIQQKNKDFQATFSQIVNQHKELNIKIKENLSATKKNNAQLINQVVEIKTLEENLSSFTSNVKSSIFEDLSSNHGNLIKYLINIQNQVSYFEETTNDFFKSSSTSLSELIENAQSDINLKLEQQYSAYKTKVEEQRLESDKNFKELTNNNNQINNQLLENLNLNRFENTLQNLSSGIDIFTKNNFNNNIEILQTLKSISSSPQKSNDEKTIHRINLLEKASKRDLSKLYNQIDALFSIHSTFDFVGPRPSMRNWAISPDLAALLVNKILHEKPKVILSAGSGVSDLIIGYCLKQIGGGKLISLEHDKKYYELSKNNIETHKLTKFVKVIYAPLKKVKIARKEWHNYDYKLPVKTKIDLFLVDGPPANTQDLARYPVLHNFKSNFTKNTSIILDDGIREEEKEIVNMWLKELKGFKSEYINTEKGTFILSRI